MSYLPFAKFVSMTVAPLSDRTLTVTQQEDVSRTRMTALPSYFYKLSALSKKSISVYCTFTYVIKV